MIAGTSTGRVCDGYEDEASTQSRGPPPSQALTVFTGSQEARSIQFFVEQTAAQLTAFFPDDLWRNRVLQVAQSDVAIRHALVSFSAYHEAYTKSHTKDEKAFALRHYNLSIKELQNPHCPGSLTHTHLLSCLIFICIELLRGHFETAIRLFKYGYGMVHTTRQLPSAPASDSEAIADRVHGLFTRLAVQVELLVGDVDPQLALRAMPGFRTKQPTIAISFTSLSEAREALLSLITTIMARTTERSVAADLLVHWAETFDAFLLSRRGTAFTDAEKRSIALIELHKKYLGLVLATNSVNGTAADAYRWDAYRDDFAEMVDWASRAMGRSAPEDSALEYPQFHLEIGVVPIMFVVGASCRDPAVRRRAIALMRSSSSQEGIWNSAVTGAVCQRIMECEEAGLDVKTCADIPAHRRVRTVRVDLAAGERHATLRYALNDREWKEAIEW